MEKLNFSLAVVCLALAVPMIMTLCLGVHRAAGADDDGNTAVVKQYFRAIDNRDAGVMSSLFAKGARQSFVGNDPIVGAAAIEAKLALVLSQIDSMKTEFISFASEDNLVFAHVKHVAVFKAGGAFKNRAGIRPPVIVLAKPTPVSWEAMATFRFEGGLIVEELIVRDELAVLQQLGSISLN